MLDSLPRVKSNHDVKVIWGPVYGIAVGMPGIGPSCKDAELRKTPFKPDDDISSAAILAGKTSNDCELKAGHSSVGVGVGVEYNLAKVARPQAIRRKPAATVGCIAIR